MLRKWPRCDWFCMLSCDLSFFSATHWREEEGRGRVQGRVGGHEGMEGGNVRKAEEGITET